MESRRDRNILGKETDNVGRVDDGMPVLCPRCYVAAEGHIYFRGPPVVIRLFFVRCFYYTLIC